VGSFSSFTSSTLAVFTGAIIAAAGCSSGNANPGDAGADSAADADPRPPTPPEWDRAVTRPADKDAETKRGSCGFKAGDLPGETLGASTAVDKDIPIDTIVVLMQENRSFDHYFSELPKYLGRNDIQVAPANASNPDKAGGMTGMHVRQHAPRMCNRDVNHEWPGSHLEWNNGANDGFFEANDEPNKMPAEIYSGDRALWWYDQRDIPFYYELAKTFAIGDHYHCSLLGPTWPNRMFLYSGTSFGMTYNNFPDNAAYEFPLHDMSIADMLEKRHVDWIIYTDAGTPGLGVVHGAAGFTRWDRRPVAPLADFYAKAAAGTLPPFMFVDARLDKENAQIGDDEHPPGDVQVGQKFVYDVVKALTTSPQWKRLALFITYDEHGGFYDSVPPPSACKPDSLPLKHEMGDTTPGELDRLGFRVPVFVVSPYAKKGYVAHGIYDHSSILRFIESKFRLPALTARDANAEPMSEFFDWKNPAFMTPPTFAAPPIDQAAWDWCKTNL
jgi:phospholipase C